MLLLVCICLLQLSVQMGKQIHNINLQDAMYSKSLEDMLSLYLIYVNKDIGVLTCFKAKIYAFIFQACSSEKRREAMTQKFIKNTEEHSFFYSGMRTTSFFCATTCSLDLSNMQVFPISLITLN